MVVCSEAWPRACCKTSSAIPDAAACVSNVCRNACGEVCSQIPPRRFDEVDRSTEYANHDVPGAARRVAGQLCDLPILDAEFVTSRKHWRHNRRRDQRQVGVAGVEVQYPIQIDATTSNYNQLY